MPVTAQGLQPDAAVQDRLLSNLRRSTIPGLDGIRGLSALAVVAFHGISLRFPGLYAVQMFFVLSGLLITWLLLRETQRAGTVSLRAFYWRRGIRLLPALLALGVWQVVVGKPHAPRGALLSALCYYANYRAAFGGDMGGLVHTWSLAVEEHFYLIWPAILILSRDRIKLTRLLFLAVCVAGAYRIGAGALTVHGSVYAAYATETNAPAILAGCSLAMLLWHFPARIPAFLFHRVLTPISLCAIVALAQLPASAQYVWGIPAGIPFAAVILLQAITYEWAVLENAVARFLGRISYGIYIWHAVAISLVEWTGRGFWHLQWLAVLGTASVLAGVSLFGIEQPIQSLGRRFKPGHADTVR
jgi:peptidoglycan/LPS O-acetylase OafA/YrhL